MFIKARRYTTKGGEERVYYSLGELRNVDGKVSSRTLLNLGQDFSLPKEHWSLVTTLVRESFGGKPSVELLAGGSAAVRVARRIIRRLHAAGYQAESPEDPYESISIQRIDFPPNANRSVGGERLAVQALELLNLGGSLKKLGYSTLAIRMVKVCIIARMLTGGDRPIVDWLRRDSALLELLDLETYPINEARLRREAQKLWPIRGTLLRRMAENIPEMYAATSIGRCRDLTYERIESDETAAFILILNARGALHGCKILHNPYSYLSDAGRIKPSGDILIVKPCQVDDQLLFRWTACGIQWVCANVEADGLIELAGPLKCMRVDFASESRLYASLGQELPDADTEAECLQFEQALTDLIAGLSGPRRLSKYQTVRRRIAAIRHQFSRASDLYDVHVSRGKANSVLGIGFHRVDSVHFGKSSKRYLLRTNLMDWDNEQLGRLCSRLAENRRLIRTLSEAGTVKSAGRSGSEDDKKADWAVTLFAYMAVQLIGATLRKRGIEAEWADLRNDLARWTRITSILTGSDTTMYLERQDTEVDLDLGRIAAAMGVHPSRYFKRSVYKF